MKVGVIGDTHGDEMAAVPHIIADFKRRGVEQIVHTGDIIPAHVSASMYGGLPVICALVDKQNGDHFFVENCPENWQFTRSEKRFATLLDGTKVYVGHKRPMDFLKASEEKFSETLADLRILDDGLRFVFGGHSHIQTLKQGHLVSLINPGAVEGAISRTYEYAVVDTKTQEIIFGRILPTVDIRPTWSLAVISDSFDISSRDANFWIRLASELKARDVSHIIHCGNLALEDIGRPELCDYTVHYAIRPDQSNAHSKLQKIEGRIPGNWKVIAETDLDNGAVVDINGYRFYVELDLGLEFMKISERGMDSMATEISRKYPETKFVLCGFTREALFVEGEHVTTINPGDTNKDRSFVVGCLPRNEWTFAHVPVDPLPPLVG